MSNATLPPSLDSLLKANSALGKKLRAGGEAPLRGLVLPSLPAALASKTEAEAVNGELLLLADTNAVAQMLRFHGPRLAKEAGLSGFTVRVQAPREPLQKNSTLKPPVLDPSAAGVLRDLAQHCDYAPLAEALERLAKLGTTSQTPSNPKD
jgi:hypothetical protein